MIDQPGSRRTLERMLLARIIHYTRGASAGGELSRLVHLMTLVFCLSFASCDQYISIAVVDAASNADNPSAGNPSSELPDKPADVGADAASIPSNPPTAGIDDVTSDAGTDAAAKQSNPPIAGNDDESDIAECDRPLVAGDCDPTKEDNECPTAATMKCFVDFQKATPTGYCAFYTPPLSGSDPCLNVIGVTDSCLPGHYCHNQVCRKLCLCDDDCLAGECCTEPIGGGFKLCADC